MTTFPFKQLDVFTSTPTQGNPLAVVLDADGLSDEQMTAFARWTNLSETTFLLRPTLPDADYRVRIFTTTGELPFAGHPTLGSCRAWLEAGGRPKAKHVVQECGVGPIRIRLDGERLAFAAPPLRRDGPLDEETIERICRGLAIGRDRVVAATWVDNGPGWLAVLLEDREDVLAAKPDRNILAGMKVGVVAPWRNGDADVEVRAFIPGDGMPEDPATGSLNAGIAQWLIGSGRLPSRYVAAQGTALGRAGRVYIESIDGDIWIGGSAVTCIDGSVSL
ncbi:PhzF family phenazine biosynthesis protein [Luteibacter rhizovicinus]|uniref:PhzF family phenazine biosynthesis protein n=1 Tax=Luteibacter rhizovicinus TaxID=242606 RepID=A0A4R3YU17_9GAMM|nr:PhzF family phenazine biosynthesis protein [Luteibacter rhizovicinus]TCV96467.1 PhzF family phenazine biosynthesis protein [Luteibacter rhizovicinus]